MGEECCREFPLKQESLPLVAAEKAALSELDLARSQWRNIVQAREFECANGMGAHGATKARVECRVRVFWGKEFGVTWSLFREASKCVVLENSRK